MIVSFETQNVIKIIIKRARHRPAWLLAIANKVYRHRLRLLSTICSSGCRLYAFFEFFLELHSTMSRIFQSKYLFSLSCLFCFSLLFKSNQASLKKVKEGNLDNEVLE